MMRHRFPDFAELIHKAVLTSPMPVESLAGKLDKGKSTLYNELNPADPPPGSTSFSKLGAEDLLEIMRLIGDVSPLEHMAGVLGYRLASMTETPSEGKTLEQELLDNLPALTDWQRVMQDPEASYDDVSRIRQTLDSEFDQDFIAWRGEKEKHAAEKKARKPRMVG